MGVSPEAFALSDAGVPYFKLVVTFIIAEFFLHAYLDLRQRKAIQLPNPPEVLKEHFKHETYEKSQRYALDKWWFGIAKMCYETAETVFTLCTGYIPWAWRATGGLLASTGKFDAWSPSSIEILTAVAFFLLWTLFSTVKDIPWSLYRTFVIEERHGFNKSTYGLFFVDLLKSIALTTLLMPPIIGILVYILQIGGPFLSLYLWAFTFAVSIIAMTIYPTLIAPLFNKYDPLPEGPLRGKIEDLAAALKFPLKKLFTVDGSKRSGHSNAYMFGFFKNKRIVLYDTLIEQCSQEQVVAVLAHELGHWKLSHTISQFVLMQILMFLRFSAFTLIRNSAKLFSEFGFEEERPVIMAFIFFSMSTAPFEAIISFLFNILTRIFEFQADGFAVKLGHGKELCGALLKLNEKNLNSMNTDPLYATYHFSHPPLPERLGAIQSKMQTSEALKKTD